MFYLPLKYLNLSPFLKFFGVGLTGWLFSAILL